VIRTRIMLLVLVVAVALPSGFADSSGGDPAPDPLQALAAPAVPVAPDRPLPAARKQRAKQERQRDRRRGGREREHRGAVRAERVAAQERAAAEAACVGAGDIWLAEVGICTHGPDPAPPGADLTKRPPPVPPQRARIAAEAVTCDDDGESGHRVQVLYVRAADVPSHYAAYLESFRTWVAGIDEIVQESAAEAGGGRRVRFVTTPECEVDIPQVVLSPTGDDDFETTIEQLRARGFDRQDRIYFAFVDSTSAGICGIAGRAVDDDPSPANRSNTGPGYARVDAGCWHFPVPPVHELMHTLGAVQLSAPNSTGNGHCIDEYDVMCYSDEPTFPAMRFDCASQAMERRLDCGHNDYFDPSPAPGSYLATHWNTANNRFLVNTEPGVPDTEPPVVTWLSPVANGETHEVSEGTVALEVEVSDDKGINRVEFSRYDAVRDKWFYFATDHAAPYTASVQVAHLQPGFNFIGAEAFDTGANATQEHVWIWNERTTPAADPDPEPPPDHATVAITAPGNGAKLKANTDVTIEVAVTDAPGAGVEVRACPAFAFHVPLCSWRVATPIGTDPGAPYAVPWRVPSGGRFTLVARATDADETLSEPVTVSIEKEKAKKKKKKKKKKRR
jgi:hypothetical protein